MRVELCDRVDEPACSRRFVGGTAAVRWACIAKPRNWVNWAVVELSDRHRQTLYSVCVRLSAPVLQVVSALPLTGRDHNSHCMAAWDHIYRTEDRGRNYCVRDGVPTGSAHHTHTHTHHSYWIIPFLSKIIFLRSGISIHTTSLAGVLGWRATSSTSVRLFSLAMYIRRHPLGYNTCTFGIEWRVSHCDQ